MICLFLQVHFLQHQNNTSIVLVFEFLLYFFKLLKLNIMWREASCDLG